MGLRRCNGGKLRDRAWVLSIIKSIFVYPDNRIVTVEMVFPDAEHFLYSEILRMNILEDFFSVNSELVLTVIVLFLVFFFIKVIRKIRKAYRVSSEHEKSTVESRAQFQALEKDIENYESQILELKKELECVREQQIKEKVQSERITAELTTRLTFLQPLSVQLEEKEKDIVRLQEANEALRVEQATTRSQMEATEEKLVYWKNTEERLTREFENLSQRIFDEKSTRFTEQNRESLTSFLSPFKQQINDFRQQVSSVYGEEIKERRSLQNEIRSLKELNQQMANEAVSLTRALKGEKKLQGNWGERVLGRVLEESGLREGHEYVQQVSLESTEGGRQQPDVIVHLPDGKDIIIDAKVSLVDYSRYHEAEDEKQRDRALAEHVKCLRNHIKELGKKDYAALEGVRTLDYVLMFISIEPAFYAAVEHQPSLFQEALDNNIMLVSPTNLLVALRTIENIWRYERQNRNTQKIADKAGSLYNKLQGLTEDMLKLGSNLKTLGNTYDAAMNKFKGGRGNVLKQAQEFVDLGVKVKKELPADLLDEALADSSVALK